MSSKKVAVGVDVGGTKVLAIALGAESHEPVGEDRRPTPDGAEALIDAIADAVRNAASDADAEVAALCVGVPGLVDDRGVMR